MSERAAAACRSVALGSEDGLFCGTDEIDLEPFTAERMLRYDQQERQVVQALPGSAEHDSARAEVRAHFIEPAYNYVRPKLTGAIQVAAITAERNLLSQQLQAKALEWQQVQSKYSRTCDDLRERAQSSSTAEAVATSKLEDMKRQLAQKEDELAQRKDQWHAVESLQHERTVLEKDLATLQAKVHQMQEECTEVEIKHQRALSLHEENLKAAEQKAEEAVKCYKELVGGETDYAPGKTADDDIPHSSGTIRIVSPW